MLCKQHYVCNRATYRLVNDCTLKLLELCENSVSTRVWVKNKQLLNDFNIFLGRVKAISGDNRYRVGALVSFH